jgi:hypothetical protein
VTARWSPPDGPLLSKRMPPKILRLPRTPEERRIANFVNRLERRGRCVEWTGTPKTGYGRFNRRGAHIFAYELWVGPLPKGLKVLHECDNPRCVLPKHLKAGTQRQNIADKIARGRGRGGAQPGCFGELNNAAKVSTKQAQMALDLYEDGYWQAEIARLTGIAVGNVPSIVRRRTWTHLTPRAGRYKPPRQLPRRWQRFKPGTKLP